MADNYLITGYWGEKHITPENDRGINAAMFGKGKFVLPVGEQFRVEYIGNNTVRMYDGKLMNNGAAAGIPAGGYVDLLIPNTEQGKWRTDYIVFRYTKDASTLIEKGEFVVLHGEEIEAGREPIPPEMPEADLLTNTATIDHFPLYMVDVEGINISTPVPLFDVSKPLLARWMYTALNDEQDLNNVNAILDEIGDGEDGGYVVGYAICKRQYSIDQTPLHSWLYRIESTNRNYARIEATTSLSGGLTMQRVRINGEWQPWEHVNPSLYIGQEYRTTERNDGKPVYIKRISCGEPPIGTTKYIGHGAINIEKIVDFGGSLTTNNASEIFSLPYWTYVDTSYETIGRCITLHVTHENIVVNTYDFGPTNATCEAWFKYTKNTD